MNFKLLFAKHDEFYYQACRYKLYHYVVCNIMLEV